MQRLGPISRRSGITRYHQLYTYLRQALLEGSIAPGSALPSEMELMRQYRLSRNTVRRALGNLQRERLVVRLQGSGTYARSVAEPGTQRPRLRALEHESPAPGMAIREQILQFATLGTPDHLLRRWPEFGRECTLVYLSRSLGGEVVSVCTRYVASQFAAGLDRERLGDDGLLRELARLDELCQGGTLSVTAVQADALTARHLGIPDGAPALCIESLPLTKEQRPLECRVHLCRPDRFRLDCPVHFTQPSGWSMVRAGASGV